MADKENKKSEKDATKEQVETFVALPRRERKEQFFSLSPEVQKGARKVIEKRRGIAFRLAGGELVLTKETYLSEILRLQGRVDELPAKEVALKSKLVELKEALLEHWGDEALAEAETALENRGAADNA